MVSVHDTLGAIVLAAAAAVTVWALIVALFIGWRPWMDWVWKAVVGLIALQILIGMVVFSQGRPPTDDLHLLYAALALGALPGASAFASNAPPRPRAWVVAIGALLTTAFVFRLFTTG